MRTLGKRKGIEGTIPKTPVIGRRYHVSGWVTGAQFVLDSVKDGVAHLSYPKRRKRIAVPVSRLRNTYRHRKHTDLNGQPLKQSRKGGYDR